MVHKKLHRFTAELFNGIEDDFRKRDVNNCGAAKHERGAEEEDDEYTFMLNSRVLYAETWNTYIKQLLTNCFTEKIF